ncbi:SCO family protein [Bacillus paralicheniformis]|jgi:protein SCO1/2|uniref:SCO family protein n=1 Tax=Bacillus paralicheniformis TaxID=1648923 RepID=UPI0005A1C210|nr:SCO family protein [Bacillus paralicheniformis]KJD53788.1 cysteine ABC transporter ATP-binding protein [Bacillus amyloliquefaciens]MBG9881217.1 cysteine ABC transporter ATP-binding protein [Bacillus paralicheniformis]MDE1392545.1 SCO family protein [Bacillus paralicheniformis]MDI0244733.1 SCO family protein [Bacillus paralicheniformis]MEC2140562.1 SCO family protein [Bacillus paralicheniformis]
MEGLKNVFGIFLAGILTVFLSSCGTSKIENSLNYDVQSFSFQNQDGKTVSLESLKGQVWVADFIFTNCKTICPPMTSHMAELQKQMEEENLQARIVSFSVDPENDTPEKLKKFAANYPLNFQNWDFLTGYSQEEIEKFALKSFKAIVKKPEDEDQVIHQSSFYLVDQNGKVVKDYDGAKKTPYDEIIADIKTLENR